MSNALSDRPLTVRQIITLDRLSAHDEAARVVGWVFLGPLVRMSSGNHVYVPPDGVPMRVPPALLNPGEI